MVTTKPTTLFWCRSFVPNFIILYVLVISSCPIIFTDNFIRTVTSTIFLNIYYLHLFRQFIKITYSSPFCFFIISISSCIPVFTHTTHNATLYNLNLYSPYTTYTYLYYIFPKLFTFSFFLTNSPTRTTE